MMDLWMKRALCLAATMTLASAVGACGDDGSGDGGEGNNAANNGVNNTPNNGVSNAPNNMPNNTPNNAGPVRESVFPISYVARNRSEIPGIEPGGKLMLAASDGSAGPVEISPEGVECDFGCLISDDLSFFFWITNDGMTSVLNAAPISSIEEDSATIDLGAQVEVATDIIGFETSGSTLIYETTSFEVFAGELPGTSATSLGVVGDVNGTQGGFYLKPGGDQAVTWTVTLTEMTLSRFDIDAGAGPSALYTFVSSGFGGTGSFYGPREKMAWSPDGRYLAVASTGLVDTDPCTSNDECVMPEVCGANARCTSQRLTINLLDLDNADKLGTGCTSTADCGGPHFCDFRDPQDPDSGRCLPGRLDLGAAGPQECNARKDGEFTDIRDNMVWGPDSQTLYFLAAEDCSRFDIPRVAILKTDTDLSSPSEVLVNPGINFSVENCYNAVDDVFTVEAEECVIDIEEMNISPDGNTLVFSGSSPAAAANMELYTIDRNGSRGKTSLTSDLETEVEQIKALDL